MILRVAMTVCLGVVKGGYRWRCSTSLDKKYISLHIPSVFVKSEKLKLISTW